MTDTILLVGIFWVFPALVAVARLMIRKPWKQSPELTPRRRALALLRARERSLQKSPVPCGRVMPCGTARRGAGCKSGSRAWPLEQRRIAERGNP